MSKVLIELDFNYQISQVEKIITIDHIIHNPNHFIDEFYDTNMIFLVSLNVLTALLSIVFCCTAIILYLKYRKLRNTFTTNFLQVIISELIIYLAKAISIFKIPEENYVLGNFLCQTQAFFMFLGETASNLWIFYLLWSIYQLFVRHLVSEKKIKMLKILSIYFVALVISIIMLLINQFKPDDESKLAWCWFKCHGEEKGSVNPVIIGMFYYYAVFVILNIIYMIRMYSYFRNIPKSNRESDKSNILNRLIFRIPIITCLGYFSAFGRRLFQLWGPSNLTLYILYIVHILFVNLKGSLYFLFCFDSEYRVKIVKIFDFMDDENKYNNEE
jgi:hypothetical protein